MVFEDSLDGFQQVRSQGQGMAQGHLAFAEQGGHLVVPGEFAEDGHGAGVVGAVEGVDGEALVVQEERVRHFGGVEVGLLQVSQKRPVEFEYFF